MSSSCMQILRMVCVNIFFRENNFKCVFSNVSQKVINNQLSILYFIKFGQDDKFISQKIISHRNNFFDLNSPKKFTSQASNYYDDEQSATSPHS